MQNYNNLLLSGKTVTEKEENYILDCHKKKVIIRKSTDLANKTKEKIEDFFDELKKRAYLIYFEEDTLHVKTEKKDKTFINTKYKLTEDALSSEKIMDEIKKLIKKSRKQSKDYEIEIISDKYAQDLYSVIYGSNDILSICNQENIDGIRKLYFAKRKRIQNGLAAKKAKGRNLIPVAIIILLVCNIALAFSFVDILFIILLDSLTGLIEKSYKLYSEQKANQILNKKIDSVLNTKDEILFASFKPEPTVLLEEKNILEEATKNDSIIYDIKKNMEVVNKVKYPGYEKHLNALYELAQDYLEAKKEFHITPKDIFDTHPNLLSRLNLLEEAINENIIKYTTDQEYSAILEGLKKLKKQPENK